MLIVCEPQCAGFEHAEVNAALLAAVCLADPGNKILFMAEREHLSEVRKKLASVSGPEVEFEEVSIPSRSLSNQAKRFYYEYRLLGNVLHAACSAGDDKVMFSSITGSGLVALKLLLPRYKGIRCFIIPHSVLAEIYRCPSCRPWNHPFWFGYALRYPTTARLTYLVPGESIKMNLCAKLPQLEPFVRSFDLPCFFHSAEMAKQSLQYPLRFGAIGVAHKSKGSDVFCSLASEVCTLLEQDRAKFTIIGPVMENSIRQSFNRHVSVPSPNRPLTRDEFETNVKNIHYAVYCHNPHNYRLTASGSMLDAFSFIKPLIALENDFFAHYFKKMGDIGYLCKNLDEMRDVIIDLTKSIPNERYLVQCNNIIKAREMFSPVMTGKQLKICLNETSVLPWKK